MNELGGYAFADRRVGMCATFAKTVTEADIVLMAHAARIARDLLSAGEENTAFLHAKIATARFYAEHVLPEAAAARDEITIGAGSTLALEETSF